MTATLRKRNIAREKARALAEEHGMAYSVLEDGQVMSRASANINTQLLPILNTALFGGRAARFPKVWETVEPSAEAVERARRRSEENARRAEAEAAERDRQHAEAVKAKHAEARRWLPMTDVWCLKYRQPRHGVVTRRMGQRWIWIRWDQVQRHVNRGYGCAYDAAALLREKVTDQPPAERE